MTTSPQHQALETLFFSNLDALRGVWDANNASSVLLSLVFYKRVLALCQEGELPFLTTLPSDYQWSDNFKLYAVQDTPQAIVQLTQTLLAFSKRNPLLDNIFAPFSLALREEKNGQLLLQVVLLLEELDFSKSTISIEEFGYFFDNALYKTALRAGKIGVKRTTPKSINQLLVALANPQPQEIIYDPTAGQGSTLIAFLKNCPELHIHGQEKNIHIWALCKMNLWANGAYQASISNKDALIEPEVLQPKADIAIAHFPFGKDQPSELIRQQSYTFIPFDVNTPQVAGNSLFVQQMLSRVKEDTGRLLAILPIQALTNDREDRKLREFLIRRDLLEAVITLPYGLLQTTGIPICILVINQKKETSKKEQVLFINGANLQVKTQYKLKRRLTSEHIEAIAKVLHQQQVPQLSELEACLSRVPIHRVILNEYNLDAKRYASPFITQLKALDAHGKLIQLEHIFRSERPHLWFDETPQQDLPYVRPENLSVSITNYLIEIHNIPTTSQVKQVAGRMINESMLLINRSGRRFKASYFIYNQLPILVNEDIMTFRVDEEKVLIEYLLLQLHDSLFIQQLNMYKTDDQHKIIREGQFELLQINLPSLEEQAQIIRETKIRLLQEEEQKVEQLRKDLNLGKQQAQSKQHKIISSLQHELGNRLPAVLTEIKNLKDYLRDKEEDESSVVFSEPIFPVFQGEDVSSIDSLGTVIGRIEAMLVHSINSLDSTSDIIKADRSKLNLQRLKIKDFLEEIQQTYAADEVFIIRIEVEEDQHGNEIPIYAPLDKTQMTTLLTNLIDNAKRHGFKNTRKHYTIHFKIGLSADQQEVVLEYKNDGTAFPSHFSFEDFISYGNYAGNSGHSGIGGYLVHQIIDNHNGNIAYRPPSDPHDPFKVHFEITLPAI
ncbi:MAG: N-6 DNA methylase [Aureispira sp.]